MIFFCYFFRPLWDILPVEDDFFYSSLTWKIIINVDKNCAFTCSSNTLCTVSAQTMKDISALKTKWMVFSPTHTQTRRSHTHKHHLHVKINSRFTHELDVLRCISRCSFHGWMIYPFSISLSPALGYATIYPQQQLVSAVFCFLFLDSSLW